MPVKNYGWLVLASVLMMSAGCGWLPKDAADAQPQPGQGSQTDTATAVDVAIARTGTLQEDVLYTGTTAPVREVSLRPQVEGKLLSLNVDVGDAIEQGQMIARLDDALLVAAVVQAEAELAARRSEVARAETEVSKARTDVQEATLKLQQLQADAARLEGLANEGAVSRQSAEQKRNEAQTAEQALRSAQVQINTEQQAVAAVEGRVTAQQAIIAQAKERLSYAVLNAPISGVVTQRLSEAGNVVQPGTELLKIGDFSQVKIVVDVSELELANIRTGQSVGVVLDAFPKEEFNGIITQISPAADPVARLVPVEITISNRGGKIGSGLLARVNFSGNQKEGVIIPETALQAGGRERGNSAKSPQNANNTKGQKSQEGTIFVIKQEGEKTTVESRKVQIGEKANKQVEIISGLQAGERFVARAGKPLKDGDPVRLSILSEQTPKNQ
ncbi:efflux RND transporter periplasmic adaptor subunit [Ancylothrix sp. C2]|uniref:efflux RND transporter periplasmic adaptor subunit n=1 Tax=Ancylothrix sp. D3o TaxID=2953691 RepID=UPI0021BAB701|nr:efflux RND transporter periplasmic adaptor subunit [Ancylothrix sp. D3o]MCT7952339.1 efflux RND transporter periplasmic adaptor subunit [Ancylothrix sp. D3o]